MKRIASFYRGKLNNYTENKTIAHLLISLLIIFFVVSHDFCAAQISRDQVIANAESFVTFIWTANPCNLWNGTRCSGAKIYSAPWVKVGENTSMPYCWGGWSSQTQYNTAMTGCKSAGQVCSASGGGCSGLPSAPLSCAGGMDCSGMVTRAWGLSTKYSTSTLVNISTAMSLSSVRPGDILNIAGSHVRLVYSNNGSSITVIETSGADWKTAYHTYTPAQLASYVPRCPNANIVTGGCEFTPPANDECAGAITLTPGASCSNTSGDIAGATQSFPASGCPSGLIQDVWYKFTATSTGLFTIRLTPSISMDGVVEAREGSCSGTVLGCADIGGGDGKVENLIISATGGTIYYIRVYEYNAAGNTTPPATTSFTICVIEPGTADCIVTSIVPDILNFNPDSHTSSSGEEITIYAQPGCAFSVSENCAWVTVTPVSGTTNPSGQALLNYAVDANTSTSSRSCTVYVNGSSFTINQDGCTYSFSPASMEVPVSGSTYNLDISSFSSCSWSIQNSYSWVHLSSSAGTGHSTINVTVDPDPCESRTGTLTVNPGNAIHTINQQGILPQLSVSPASLNFTSSAGSNSSVISSNLVWTASAGTSWITVSPASGNGNGTLTITVADNNGGERSGTVTVAGCNKSEVITVQQSAGAPVISEVTYPDGPGITWTLGNPYTITWNGFGTSNVKIELYQGTKRNRIITSSTVSDGSFDWTVPSNQKTGTNFFIKITSVADASMYDYSDNAFTITGVKSGILSNNPDEGSFDNSLNIYPNPFSSELKIAFQVLKESGISITIFDAEGKKVKDLVSDQIYGSGIYEITINGDDLVPGIYYCEFKSRQSRVVRKVIKL